MKNNQTPPAIVRIHRPNLTPEERDKRMEAIKQAATKLILAARNTHT